LSLEPLLLVVIPLFFPLAIFYDLVPLGTRDEATISGTNYMIFFTLIGKLDNL